MATMETQFVIHTEHTQYRVRPNPDSAAEDGSEGLVLEWRDAGDKEWSSYFFVAPDAIPKMIAAMTALLPK